MSKTLHKAEVGARLLLVREALGLSQQQMAARYGSRSDKSLISNWERGKHYPDPWFVKSMFERDGVTPDWLYLGRAWSMPASLVGLVEAAQEKREGAAEEN